MKSMINVSAAVTLASTLLVNAALVNSAPAQQLRVVESDETVSIVSGEKLVVAYNKVSPPAPKGIDPVYRRSGCLHPIRTPQGRVVTTMFPFDHPHQHGVFSAWVKTRYAGKSIDFWDLAGGTGRVVHERVVGKFRDGESAGFEVDLIHRAEVDGPVDVLRERWKITAHPTDGTYFCFDLETEQSALTEKPLLVSKYHYGGIVFRGPVRWLTAADRDARKVKDLEREPSEFLNSLGSNRIQGNLQRAKWVALSGSIDGKKVSIAVLCHTESFRAPQAARLHPTKPYFCFAPCNDGAFQIDREHPFRGRYRYLVSDTAVDAKWIDQQWREWTEKK